MMKKIFLIAICCMMSSLAVAAPYRGMYGNNYKKNGNWYFGAHADLTLLNWKNDYKTSGYDNETEKFSFKPVFGADFAIGYNVNRNYRFDFELGYVGEYTDSEKVFAPGYLTEKTDFSLYATYLLINQYYNVWNGLYIGVGAGGALVGASVDYTYANKVSKNEISPMGALMFGWANKLDDNVSLDIRYRFSAFEGPELTGISATNTSVDVDWSLNHTISLGIIYNF